MVKCKSCSSMISANSSECVYCGTKNDIDINFLNKVKEFGVESQRKCPVCDVPMKVINVGEEKDIIVEHCETCFGLFFDIGELKQLLKEKVKNVFSVNYKRLDIITKEFNFTGDESNYRKCPDCQSIMHKKNFGERSGVVIDACYQHGIWLDSGELRHIIEWKKAGGEILNNAKSDAMDIILEFQKERIEISKKMKNKDEKTKFLERDFTHFEYILGALLLFLIYLALRLLPVILMD